LKWNRPLSISLIGIEIIPGMKITTKIVAGISTGEDKEPIRKSRFHIQLCCMAETVFPYRERALLAPSQQPFTAGLL
jgi:hypothetical protein